MKIKDLPKEIVEVVKRNARVSFDEDDALAGIFIWERSPEGQEFWSKIDDGDFSHFYKKYPSQDKMFMDEYLIFDMLGDIKVKDAEVVKQPEDSIVEAIVNSFKERSEAGFNKYGTNLDREDLSSLEWLSHLQEELQDAILYAERLKKDLTIEEKKETSYPLLKVQTVEIKSPIGHMKFGVNEVSLNYSLDGKTITLDIK
jgi:hypothetical protein